MNEFFLYYRFKTSAFMDAFQRLSVIKEIRLLKEANVITFVCAIYTVYIKVSKLWKMR